MAREKKLHLLHLSFDTPRDGTDVEAQLRGLEGLLNEGWDVLQAIPLGAAGGIAGVQADDARAPLEPLNFAFWAALFVLQKGNSN